MLQSHWTLLEAGKRAAGAQFARLQTGQQGLRRDQRVRHGSANPFECVYERVCVGLSQELLDLEQDGRVLREDPHLAHDETVSSESLSATLLSQSAPAVLRHFFRESRGGRVTGNALGESLFVTCNGCQALHVQTVLVAEAEPGDLPAQHSATESAPGC